MDNMPIIDLLLNYLYSICSHVWVHYLVSPILVIPKSHLWLKQLIQFNLTLYIGKQGFEKKHIHSTSLMATQTMEDNIEVPKLSFIYSYITTLEDLGYSQ